MSYIQSKSGFKEKKVKGQKFYQLRNIDAQDKRGYKSCKLCFNKSNIFYDKHFSNITDKYVSVFIDF